MPYIWPIHMSYMYSLIVCLIGMPDMYDLYVCLAVWFALYVFLISDESRSETRIG